MIRGLSAAGALVLGQVSMRRALAMAVPGDAAGAAKATAESASAESKSKPSPRVLEILLPGLRGEDGRIGNLVLEDAVLAAAAALRGDQDPPLDALAEMFPDDPPVAVLVNARAGSATTRMLATRLAVALADMGSDPPTVLVLDAADDDLTAGGYRIARQGEGPYCFGTRPATGYGNPLSVRAAEGTVRLSRGAEGTRKRLAVVARLQARGPEMGPFVLDAALRCLDEGSRARAVKDPAYGARVLSSPLIGGRIGLVLGDLIEIPMESSGRIVPQESAQALGPERSPSGAPAENRPSTGGMADTSIWKADEILAGQDLFAVERVGHTILDNSSVARGGPRIRPHPILTAAATLRIPGAAQEGLDWRKLIR